MTAAILFKYLFWAWTASEFLLQVVTRTRRSGGELKDRGSLLLLLPAIFCSIWVASWYGEVHGRTMLNGIHGLKTAALLLLIAGLIVRWTAILSLGRSFSTNVAIRPTQTVKRDGLYRWVRHPSYTGMLLIFAAVGLSIRNWISLSVMLVFPTAALLYRIQVEERALNEAFGQEYSKYSRDTKRLLPWIY